MTYLEDLPDEILMLIYRYLNSIDILYAFTDLNKRIEQTLFESKQHINLQYIPLKQFCFFIQNLSTFKDYIVSFVVDDEWTDGIPLSCALLLPQLQKLTIVSFHKANLDAFLNPVSFPMLESLHLGKEAIPLLTDDESKPSTFLYQIHKLKRVHWGENFIGFPFGAYSVENFIEHLTISVDGASTVLIILKCSPCLRYFKGFAIDDDGPTDTMDVHLPHLRQFHLSVTNMGDWSWSTVDILMQCLPSTLERFSFEGAAGFQTGWLDGNAWARSVPNSIQSFQLILTVYYSNFFPFGMSSEQIKQSWSTPFWIHEKHCYIQCFDLEFPQPHFLLCTDDCSDFDSFDNSMAEAKHVFNLKPNDSTNFVPKSIGQLDLNSLNRDAHAWIDQRRQMLPTVERLSFQNGRLLLTTDIAPYYIDLFQHLRCLTLPSSVNDDLIQYVSSFSRLTSLAICDLTTATLILNCDRSFNLIKILRINIEDLDIDHIELDRLFQVFPHLYGFQIGFILYTQLERLMNEKLAGVIPISLRISFRPKSLGKIEKENDKISDQSAVENEHEPEQKTIRNVLAHDVAAWFKNYTFLGTLPSEHEWTAVYYAYECQFGAGHDCLTVWHWNRFTNQKKD